MMMDEPLDRPRPISVAQRLLTGLHLDGPLLLGILTVSGLGLFVLYSAGSQNEDLVIRQGVRIAVAATSMLLIAQIHPKYLRIWSPWMFLAGIVLLVLVLVMGDVGKGAQRWLDIGIVRFQPSEIMKLAVPMMAAWYLHERPLPPTLKETLIVIFLIALMPAALIARQPDLGTALLIAASGILVILLAGMSIRLILAFGASGLAAAPAITSSSPRSPLARVASSARAGSMVPRRSWSSCRNGRPTSSSPCSARSSACWGCWPCCSCTC
jgi:rod shape determining protein RodA